MLLDPQGYIDLIGTDQLAERTKGTLLDPELSKELLAAAQKFFGAESLIYNSHTLYYCFDIHHKS